MIARMKPRQLLLAISVLYAGLAGSRMTNAQTTPAASPAKSVAVTVPFVGCASDGQVGPQKAPTGKSVAIAVPAAIAKRLAYYKAEYRLGTLAPRGWNCFSIYGSDGSQLFVSPDPIDSATLMSVAWKGFTGDAVQISDISGGTSGRFEVAKVIARVFPDYKAFVQSVIAEGIEPASDFPFGPYPGDKLTYRGKNIVEFETPANAQGLGTASLLLMNASPIDGVAIIAGKDTDLTHLSVRVTAADGDLIPFIVKQVESEAAVATSN
jgi:hypothetical protein